jgi:hypothetical protein
MALIDQHFFDHCIFGVFSQFRQGREAPAKPVNPLTELGKYADARDRNNGCPYAELCQPFFIARDTA